MDSIKLKKDLLSCPGDTIQETIDTLGMSQAELALRMGRSKEKLNELIKGKATLTPETARKLENVLGISASGWLNLERMYRDELLEIRQLEQNETYFTWAKKFPLKQLRDFNALSDIRNKNTLPDQLFKFFRVASPGEWDALYRSKSVAYKINLNHSNEAEAISAWLRLGELQAEKLELQSFNRSLLLDKISEIKDIAYNYPENWQNKLQNLCAECGIALVYTPCIAKALIYGATRWIKNNTIPLVQLTDRQKDANAFWFTFYHELAHILFHGKKDFFIDAKEGININKEKEEKADSFASEMLINKKVMKVLLDQSIYVSSSISGFSEKYKIHPGIIVSQLQRLKKIPYNRKTFNNFKKHIEIPNLTL